MNGVATTTSIEVVKFAQTRSGIRQNVIPGARMVMIVTRKLSAVAIDDAPAHWTAIEKKMFPQGCEVESGGEVGPPGPEPPRGESPPGQRPPGSGGAPTHRAG